MKDWKAFSVVAASVGFFISVPPSFGVETAPESPIERVDEFEQIEEGEDASAPEPEAETEAEPEVQPTKSAGKGGTRAKEAEGSKAPNRFKADVVTKSSYRLNGEPLEVDPD